MAIHNMGLSWSILTWKPIENPKQISTWELSRVISQLWFKSHYIESPQQALDLIDQNKALISRRNDIDFCLWIIYILWEYLNWNEDYQENADNTYHQQWNWVNAVRNRKWIISEQIFQILLDTQETENSRETTKISNMDVLWLSQKITEFVVSNADAKERRKVQTLKNILLRNMWLDKHSDWTVLLEEINKKVVKSASTNKKTA